MTAHTGPSKGARAPSAPLYKPEQFEFQGALHQLVWRGVENGEAKWLCVCGAITRVSNYKVPDNGERVALFNHEEALKSEAASSDGLTWECEVCGAPMPLKARARHLQAHHKSTPANDRRR